MEKEIVEKNDVAVAIAQSEEPIITDVATALDLMANVSCDRFVMNKEAFVEDFFDLRTGLAGEILQKFINYGNKLVIYGDFSMYTSKSLRDFMYECNQGKDVFFMSEEGEAVEWLVMGG